MHTQIHACTHTQTHTRAQKKVYCDYVPLLAISPLHTTTPPAAHGQTGGADWSFLAALCLWQRLRYGNTTTACLSLAHTRSLAHSVPPSPSLAAALVAFWRPEQLKGEPILCFSTAMFWRNVWVRPPGPSKTRHITNWVYETTVCILSKRSNFSSLILSVWVFGLQSLIIWFEIMMIWMIKPETSANTQTVKIRGLIQWCDPSCAACVFRAPYLGVLPVSSQVL